MESFSLYTVKSKVLIDINHYLRKSQEDIYILRNVLFVYATKSFSFEVISIFKRAL